MHCTGSICSSESSRAASAADGIKWTEVVELCQQILEWVINYPEDLADASVRRCEEEVFQKAR